MRVVEDARRTLAGSPSPEEARAPAQRVSEALAGAPFGDVADMSALYQEWDRGWAEVTAGRAVPQGDEGREPKRLLT